MTALTLSAEEAIAMMGDDLDLKPETLREWARAGKIGSVKIGRDRRFTEAHVKAYLDENSQEPIAYGRSPRSRPRRTR